MAFDTDILVIGAGPIGLINAWGMKYLNPKLKIVVLEKYAVYQRDHTLVVQAKQLEAVMKSTQSEHNPTMIALLQQLKKDPHIRTNSLQNIFTKLAQEIGIHIKTKEEVTPQNMEQKLKEEYPNLRLIIGADGTHSTVSDTLFSKDNQVKHEFDYVLQVRFEIHGTEKAPGIQTQNFYQQMARKGLIANEYVGHFEEGKTPVTMQMMISKEDFLHLKKLTSKKPLTPFKIFKSDSDSTLKPGLPAHLKSFISTYLKNKIADLEDVQQQIDPNKIRISVNEAPATYAKKVVNQHKHARVVLEGDAALGLSYFKGLNAGLEASARFLTTIAPAIKNSFGNTKVLDTLLDKYQRWFMNDFSPKKVKEVGKYSFWNIRSFMSIMKTVQHIKNASMSDVANNFEPVIIDYFNHFTKDPLIKKIHLKWRPFPHREYEPVLLGQFDYIPLKYTANKMVKVFADFIKPYKSNAHLKQDFKQPFVGITNLMVGFGKFVAGIPTLNFWSQADGLMSMMRGATELISTPLNWILKPITRGIATFLHGGYTKIEENSGIRNLAHYGQKYLEIKPDTELTSEKTIYELLAVCNDIHRKFDKSLGRGQATKIGVEEDRSYSEIRAESVVVRKKLVHYFSLFTPKKEETNEKSGTSVLECRAEHIHPSME